MISKYSRIYILVAMFVLSLVGMTACDVIESDTEGALQTTGVIEAVEVIVSPEVSGIVKQVHVSEGEKVTSGQLLFTIESDLLNAQFTQAQAAYDSALAGLDSAEEGISLAEANLRAAEINLEQAELQYDTILRTITLAEQPLREDSWNDRDLPSEFELPSWYFGKDEEMTAAEAELAAASESLEIEKKNLADTLADVSNADFRGVEERLSRAQVAFLIADELLDRDIEQNGRDSIDTTVQALYDSAEAELESAQTEYENMLSSDSGDKVLEARARVDVANERYYLALAYYHNLQTGTSSLEVLSASLAVEQAQAILSQAESGLEQARAYLAAADHGVSQAEANLDLASIQLEKANVVAAVDGVILVQVVEEGELVSPGMAALKLGRLDTLTVTVYLAEDLYGQISLEDTAEVRVDSYPDETYQAKVIRIAEEAEYTPRNVQTEEDRRSTVFAVELVLLDGLDRLKPGMPADVTFDLGN
jgi:multidrug resistance efflux pump